MNSIDRIVLGGTMLPLLLALVGCGIEDPGTRARQRSTVDVPDLPGVRVRIGDISLHDSAYAEITILGPKDEFLVPRRTVREGESVGFRVGEVVYQFVLVRIEHHLTSDDFLFFRVVEGGEVAGEPGEVRVLQRSEVGVPGLEEALVVSIDDIRLDTESEDSASTTVTVREKKEGRRVLLEAKGVREGARLHFEHDGRRYLIDVVDFDLHVTNPDYATLVIRPVQE